MLEDLGHLAETGDAKPSIAFNYPYKHDARFLVSPHKTAIDALGLPRRYEETGVFVMDDLAMPYGVEVEVAVQPSNIPNTSNGGYLVGDSDGRKIIMHFDPTYENATKDLSQYTESILAHELNHAAREQSGTMGSRTLLDALIAEGLAVYYQEHLRGEFKEVPWGRALDSTDLQKQWQLASRKLFSHISQKEWGRWFAGNSRQHRPVYTGYRLGNMIIRAYMEKNADILMGDLVRMSSEKILEESGFSYHQPRLWLPTFFRRK